MSAAPNVGTARVMDLRAIAEHGEHRRRAIAEAEAELEAVVDELVRVQVAGGRINVKLAAELAGVTRTTIYDRLRGRNPQHR